MDEKSPEESRVVTRDMVMPYHTNPIGSLFGGVLMSWIDIAAVMAAQKHAGTSVVTASVDQINFRAPLHAGDHAVIEAIVTYAGNTSLEVLVEVEREDITTNERVHVATAYLTFVAVDADGKKRQVPRLRLEGPEEKRRAEAARERIEVRKRYR